MIQNEISCIANSLWTATANATPACPPLVGEAETEVAIIGGGYTGLSAALHLAEANVSVTLLETETPGWGASGRNGGQVNPGLKEDPDDIEKHFGKDLGGRMVALSGGAADLLFGIVKRHNIDCDARQVGWVQPVHNEGALTTVSRRVEQWSRRGQPLRMLSRDETAAILGADAYIGAMIDERGGNVHPLNYALGLATAAQKAGAVLHGQSRVLKIETTAFGYVLHTAQGRLRARKVLLGTNGYTGDVTPELARSVVPIRSIQVATEPLPEDVRRSILPGGHSASDSRRLLLYFRMDAGGRFVMGGRGAYTESGTLRHMETLREVSRQLYPALANARWKYSWGGFVAMTQDHYPHLNKMGPNMMAAVGFNGRGVAMGTALGKVLADWAIGADEKSLPFPVTPVRPIPFYFMRKPAVAAVVAWSRVQDRLGK